MVAIDEGGLRVRRNNFDLEKAQEMLDNGFTRNKTASELGIHHSYIIRAIERGLLFDDYFPFDEEEDTHHLSQNFEWLWEEDKLEEICNQAFDKDYVNISELFERDDFLRIGRFVRDNYGSIRKYLIKKNKTMLKRSINFTCYTCNEVKNVTEYGKASKRLYGIKLDECRTCNYAKVRKRLGECPEYAEKCKAASRAYAKTEEGRLSLKVSQLNRRAIKELLLDTLTTSQVEIMLTKFNGCALTGNQDSLHLDHVIPLSVGHGGTTFENIIPLSDTLNLSKNDGNLFEWFETNRQRFNLSQDKFNTLIDYLAELNEMTREEYREYVYWCHANPRTVEQLRKEAQ
jgi:5-methylcytosine-specific restriction endonuclease McrA